MNNPLGVSPSKGKQGTTRGKEKNLHSQFNDRVKEIGGNYIDHFKNLKG